MPDLLVVALDTNCRSYVDTIMQVKEALKPELASRAIFACPDPHVELWYLADLDSFFNIVGCRPAMTEGKCTRNYYKNILKKAVIEAGHPSTLGGIEFASELVQRMDLYKAGKTNAGLKHFLSQMRSALRQPAG